MIFRREPTPEITTFRRAIWQNRDRILADAAAEGEWHVARIRLILVGLLLIIPTYRIFLFPPVREYVTGFIVTLVAAVAAVVMFVVLKRGNYRTGLGFFSSIFDVSLVSVGLASFVTVGPPYAAANSRVTFPIYFLAIGAASLRYDRRVCVVAGVLAMVEYYAIVAYEVARWGINDPQYAPFSYGIFAWPDQITRIILLFSATLLSFEIVRRAQHLREMSHVDVLTGLPNRAYFDRRAIAELNRADRYGRSFSLAIIDVDHFKRINDTYGHASGDRVLRGVANVLCEHLRASDVVARYGGEEFVVLLPETTIDQAINKLEMLRLEMENAHLETGDREATQVTISAGISSYPSDATEHDDLLRTADARLLSAKQSGRNRVAGPYASAQV